MIINNNKFKEPVEILNKTERVSSFKEVEFVLSDSNALKEAQRCLNCKTRPCVSGCPVGVKIPEFINCIVNNNLEKAYDIISENNFLPAICGRVCPQEKQCESKCVKNKIGEPVAIGRLERYVSDKFVQKNNNYKNNINKNSKKIAVIGSGPSGLTCAAELASKNFQVDIFEALHTPGGVLSYGIPKFRLPRNILDSEISKLKNLGVNIKTNIIIGKSLSIKDLFDMNYSAVYISTGAGLPKLMNIPGENLVGVYYANEFLTRVNLMNAHDTNYDTPMKIPEKILVIGGGNVAMDVARTAVRIGCKEVFVMYRRTEQDMPARRDEVIHAKEENIKFLFLKTPVKFIGENNILTGLKYVNININNNKLEPDYTQEFELKINNIIIAIGNNSNKILFESEHNDINFEPDGRIITNTETTQTSMKYVYAGGDAVTGAATVIEAMGAGKRAAEQIQKDLENI